MSDGSKGYALEERLRQYFIRSGYYTLRSVPFIYEGFDITDVDIWLYDRPSSIARHRAIVDVKNKKTPQAIEMIFWTKGLQYTLGVDQAIVATTDKRAAVSEFGKQHNVLILDGHFIDLLSRTSHIEDRLSEEELLDLIANSGVSKISLDWKTRLLAAKKRILLGLDYSSVNQWLTDARFFAEQSIVVATERDVAGRLMCLVASFVAIGLDFVFKDLAFCDAASKRESINAGLRYGSDGVTSTTRVLNLAVALVEEYLPHGRTAAIKIRNRLNSELSKIPTNTLAVYFSRSQVSQDLFKLANELEHACYSREAFSISMLSAEVKSYLGVLLDFWEIDRRRLFDVFDSVQVQTSSALLLKDNNAKDSAFQLPQISVDGSETSGSTEEGDGHSGPHLVDG